MSDWWDDTLARLQAAIELPDVSAALLALHGRLVVTEPSDNVTALAIMRATLMTFWQAATTPDDIEAALLCEIAGDWLALAGAE